VGEIGGVVRKWILAGVGRGKTVSHGKLTKYIHFMRAEADKS